MTFNTAQSIDQVSRWDSNHRYAPAVRHRRRLLLRMLGGLPVRDMLDAGCAQPYLLAEITGKLGISGAGCDLSEAVIAANRTQFPQWDFAVVDLGKTAWPEGRQFDLVVSSEVLEHIPEWRAAVGHLAGMCRRFLAITVPSGRIYPIDRHIGHVQHFAGPELAQAVKEEGFRIITLRRWGFPFHTLYKHAINDVAPGAVYAAFGEQQYGPGKRLLAALLYGFFFLNDLFTGGGQLLLLAERVQPGDK